MSFVRGTSTSLLVFDFVLIQKAQFNPWQLHPLSNTARMASEQQQRVPTRERRPSTGAPIVDIQGAVGPAGISRPKHKRTVTGLGPGEIKSVEGESNSTQHEFLLFDTA